MTVGANTYEIHSITFGEQWIEVVFTEKRNVSKRVVDITTRLIDPTLFKDLVASIHEDVEDLVDQAFVHRRNTANQMESEV